MKELELLKEYIKENIPSAEVFDIYSTDGKKVIEQSFDGKDYSVESIVKKQGLTILLTNY